MVRVLVGEGLRKTHTNRTVYLTHYTVHMKHVNYEDTR